MAYPAIHEQLGSLFILAREIDLVRTSKILTNDSNVPGSFAIPTMSSRLFFHAMAPISGTLATKAPRDVTTTAEMSASVYATSAPSGETAGAATKPPSTVCSFRFVPVFKSRTQNPLVPSRSEAYASMRPSSDMLPDRSLDTSLVKRSSLPMPVPVAGFKRNR